METKSSNIYLYKLTLVIIFLLECFALPMQFYLLINNAAFSITGALIRFFSFFTILTNSLVALCSGVLLFGNRYKAYNFFHKHATLAAITVYIIIVGLVYNIMLRPLENLVGIHKILTEIFHSVVPLLFLLYWICFVPKQNIPWKSILLWLIYPLLYVIYTILHGKYTGFYPYPFIDVSKIGFAKAMQNGVFVLLAFVLVSFILIAIGKIQKK